MTLVLMQNTRLPKYCPLSSLLKAAYLLLSSYIFLKSIFLYLLNIRNLTSIIFLFTLPDSIRLYVFGHESVSIYQKLAILLCRFTYCHCSYRERVQLFYSFCKPRLRQYAFQKYLYMCTCLHSICTCVNALNHSEL